MLIKASVSANVRGRGPGVAGTDGNYNSDIKSSKVLYDGPWCEISKGAVASSCGAVEGADAEDDVDIKVSC